MLDPLSVPADAAARAPARAASGLPTAARAKGCLLYMLAIVGLFGLIVGAPFVLGSFFAERYEAEITFMLASPPEKVFAAVQDVQKNPMTGQMMQRIERLASSDAGLPRWREEMTGSEVTVETTELVPGRRVRRSMRDSVVPMTAESEIELTPTETGGTRVHARSVTTIRAGAWQSPLFRFMMTIFGGAQTSLEGYWMHLAKDLNDKITFEKKGAQPPTPTAAPAAPPR